MAGTQPRASHWSLPWRSSAVVERGAPGEVGEALFLKRFHDRRPLGGLRDRWRAAREKRGLEALERAGIRAPGFVSLARTSAGVELAMQRISGARTLDEVLEDRPDERAPALARSLGALLARLHAGGLSHGDLHAGNVLVDGAGRPWLVDASAVRRATRRRVTADLLQAAGAARERVGARFRARFLIAYLRELPHALRDRLLAGGTRAALAERIERDARAQRAAEVERLVRRWLRESRCVARDATDGTLHARAAPATALAPDAATTIATAKGARRALRAAWRCAARLAEHRVPAARPATLLLGREPRARFGEPAGAREVPRGARGAHALGVLAGTLHDRGLAPRVADAALDAHGVGFLRASAGVERSRDLPRALAPWSARHAEATPRERAAFAAGFLRAQRGTRREEHALRLALLGDRAPARPRLESAEACFTKR